MSSQLYDGAASIGKFEGIIKLYGAAIISIIFICISIYMFLTNNSNLVNTSGKITVANCSSSTNCNLRVTYMVNGTTYNGSITVPHNKYKIGENIDITYDSTAPVNITLKKQSNITLSIVSLVCALIIGGFAYLNYYLTSNYKMFAAVEGADTVFKIL